MSGNADFTIQWHYSPSLPAENNTTTTDTDIDNYDQQYNGALRIQQELLNGSGIHKISLLTLTGYDDKTAGYYWCSVNSSSNRTPNPSQVLHISPQCFLESMTYGSAMAQDSCSMLNLYETPNKSRCADFNESLDIVNASCQIEDEGKTSAPTNTATKPTLGKTDFDTKTTTMANSQVSDQSTFEISDPDQSTSQFSDFDQSTSEAFPMHFIWMTVGIVFAILFGIIVVMLIIIVYLTRKRNKIKGIQQFTMFSQ